MSIKLRSGNVVLWSWLAELMQGCFTVITGPCLVINSFHFIKLRLTEKNMDESSKMLKFKNNLFGIKLKKPEFILRPKT